MPTRLSLCPPTGAGVVESEKRLLALLLRLRGSLPRLCPDDDSTRPSSSSGSESKLFRELHEAMLVLFLLAASSWWLNRGVEIRLDRIRR